MTSRQPPQAIGRFGDPVVLSPADTNDETRGSRLLALFAFVTAIVVALSVYSLYGHARSVSMSALFSGISATLNDRTLQLVNEETGVRGYVATRDRQFLDIYYHARNRLRVDDARLTHAASGDRSVDNAVASLRPIAEQVYRYFVNEIGLMSHGHSSAAITQLRTGKSVFDTYRRLDDGVSRVVTRELNNRRRINAQYAERAIFIPPIAGVMIVLCAAAFMVLLRNMARMQRSGQRAKDLEELNNLKTMAEEMTHVGYWRFDLRTRERHWSNEVYRILGLSPGTPLPTETVIAAYAADDRQRVSDIIERTIATGTSYRFETRIVRPNGVVRDIVSTGQLERGTDGTPLVLKGAFQDITERKNVERERDRLLARMTLGNEAGKVGIWDWDMLTNVVLWDDNMFALRGREVILGEHSLEGIVFETTHPDDREQLKAEIELSVATDKPYEVEYRVLWPTGEIHYVRSRGKVIRGAANEPLRMVGTDWDITESRNLAAQLRVIADHDRAIASTLLETNRLLTMAEQLSHVGHFRLDLVTNDLYWSDEVYRTHGLATTEKPKLEEAIAFYHPDERAKVEQVVAEAIANGGDYSFESRLVRPDGTIRHVVCSGQSELDADGTVVAIFGVFQDITATKDAERERLELLERVTLATQAGRIGIWDLNISRNSVSWDANCFALYGMNRSAEERSNDLWVELLHSDDRERVTEELAAVLGGKSACDTEFRIVWENGEIHHIRSLGTLVRDESGVAVRLVGVNWDITEVRSLAEQLRQEKERLLETVDLWTEAKTAADKANRAKSDFLARMSHEIRTPMNGIIGFTTLVLESTLTIEQRRHLMHLHDAGTSLMAIINDILDFSKIEAGKIEIEQVPLNPEGVVDAALSIIRSDARAKGVELDFSVAPDVPRWVIGDPTRLRQILLNLLTNALKFTPSGRISVTIRRAERVGDGDRLHFQVTDTGIGIPPEKQHLLFRDFSQVSSSTTRQYGGTGLGLAISQRLVEAMHGTIGATSNPGRGSTFWFNVLLPATDPPVSQANVTASAIVSRRILVADDNNVNQIVVEALLKKDGHDVVLVSDGAQAVAAMQAGDFDVLLMDMQMPVLDGIEATRAIRRLAHPACDIPIVALTANAMANEVKRCLDAGMNDHLAKPIDRKALRRALARWGGGERPATIASDAKAV